ncbi:MAG: nitroreductase family protein [Thermoplasmata archaeon]|jgi:nitroreductase|nr:nitroreductase family protein [Thermoplasmata archaeon]
MDVMAAIQARKSIRKYEDKPIPKELLDNLLESARLAPSANNAQKWSIIVITDKELLRKLVPASGNQRFVGECSAYLVGVAEPGAHYSAIDMTIALDHLTLYAVEKGLGTCWIGDFDEAMVKEILGIPKERAVPICLTLGFPAQAPPARRRKKLSELFHMDRWGSPLP